MVTYLPRSAWTDTARGGATLVADDLVGLALHYPGRAAPYGVLSQAQVASILRGIRNWSVGTKGFADIDYQVCIDQAGRVWDLRGIGRVPAAHASASNPRANWHYGAVLLLIGNDERPSAAMIEALRHFRHTVWLARWTGTTGLRDHSQVPGASTSCAGPHVRALLADGSLAARPGSGTGGGTVTAPSGNPALRVTDPWTTDPRVGELQTALNAVIGAGLKVDNVYGPKTAQAVSDFQTWAGIDVDGVYGPQTQAALQAALDALNSSSSGSSGGSSTGTGWSTDLSRNGSPQITNLADDTMPDNWGRRAAQLLGYAAAHWAWWRNTDVTSPATGNPVRRWRLAHWAYDRAHAARDEGRERGALLAKVDEKLDVLVGAQEGLDTAAILKRVDSHYEELRGQFTVAEQQRRQLGDQLDALVSQLDDVHALVAAGMSGERDATDVLQELANILQAHLSGVDAE